MPTSQKVYDFPMPKVEEKLVSYLKHQRGESTVADMIAGTGLPKFQVEQAAKLVLDEYAGRLKVTESGELLYYFPSGMRSTAKGFGPSFRRFWKTFTKGAARVLSLLFKIWIVGMLVGYFVAFVALVVLAIVASFAASAAGRDRNGRGRGGDMGLGGSFMFLRLFDLILRMWFWTTIFKDPRQKPKSGRAFYKSVFAFVFGDGDPNQGWEEAERRYVIAYIRGQKGVLTLEELMTITGKEQQEANTLLNRLLVEYEGEPGVTDNGTVVYSFPALMRTSEERAPDGRGSAPPAGSLLNPLSKKIVPFSSNKRKTNGWIAFFNAFNLAFGSYFLVISITMGASALAKTGPALYSMSGNLLSTYLGVSPVPFLGIALGAVPVVFSILFFVVAILRKVRLDRQNNGIREESLRKRVLAHVFSSPSRVDPKDIRPSGNGLDPKNFPAVCRRMVERLAAAFHAEPLAQDGGSGFAYRFSELEREIADLQSFRRRDRRPPVPGRQDGIRLRSIAPAPKPRRIPEPLSHAASCGPAQRPSTRGLQPGSETEAWARFQPARTRSDVSSQLRTPETASGASTQQPPTATAVVSASSGGRRR